METTTATEAPTPTIIIDADYEQSPQLEKFAEALAAAQGEIDNADKAAKNPHFNTRYADLASVINACREPLAKQKIARLQTPRTRANGEVGVRTALLHSSGQFIACTFWCRPEKPGPQPLGSVLTYLRRYGLAAVVGVGQEEDDGNAGNGRGEPPRDWNENPPKGQQPANGGQPPKGQGAAAAASQPATSAKPASPAPAAASDPELAADLKKIRDCVGNELKWDRKTAVSFLQECFGVDSTDKLSRPQAAVCLQLVLAGVDGDEAYKAAKAKALKESPALFAPQKGAAA
jgi:hypothetical protein